MHEGTGTYMQVICRVYALCRRDECLGDDLPTKDSPCPRREAQGLGPEQTHIELLHFTTVLVQNYGPALEEARRDIIKCTWNFITSEDAMVHQVAYLLAANFFAA